MNCSKTFFARSKTEFTKGKSSFGQAQKDWDWYNLQKRLVYHKTFETVQNVLGPVEERGIGSTYFSEKLLISLIFITNKVALEKKEYTKISF